jgi:predicted DNA-binding transcriptional regulator AlpA
MQQLLREVDIVGRKATSHNPAKVGLISISRATLWRLVKAGKFPASQKSIEGNFTFWRASEVQAWIDKQGGAK